ncbi:MAG: pilus assembly protein TadG-related protein, partial [Acidimicrobiia bacterium]
MIRWGTHRARSTGTHDRERGAVIIVAAVAMTVVMASAALAIDVGRLALTKRELQAVADLSSLDAVRALGDLAGEAGGLSIEAYATKLAREAALRNGFDPDVSGHTLDVAVGTFDRDTATFVVTTDETLRNAVRVTAGTSIDWAFTPGHGSVSATAVAMVGEEAGVAVGSFLARLDTHKSAVLNGLLTGLLGGSVTLDLVSYQGVAAATVELGALGSALGFTGGSVNELLATEVTLRELLAATATALTAQGDSVSLTAATPVSTLAAATNPALRLRLGDLLEVAEGSGTAALAAELNVLQLVAMSAQVADGDHFLSATMPVAIPGVTSTSLDLALIEAPRIAIGPARRDGTGQWVTRAVTAQVRAQLRLQFQELLDVLGVTGPVS